VTGYLADTSALARLQLKPVRERLEPLITRGLISLCAVTELELLTSARNRDDYERIKSVLLPSFSWTVMDERSWSRALEVQEGLAARGQHRAASIPDLLLAAVAEMARLTVLHYDRDFDTIAGVTGQPTEWVVPAGSV
jgi:predicted nucleic acid-binding protein